MYFDDNRTIRIVIRQDELGSTSVYREETMTDAQAVGVVSIGMLAIGILGLIML